MRISKARMLMVVMAFSVSTVVTAQYAAPPKSVQPFDLKGITPTTSLAEATPKLQKIDDYAGSGKGGHLIDDLVNGRHALINAVFDDKGLVAMHGHPSDYQETKPPS